MAAEFEVALAAVLPLGQHSDSHVVEAACGIDGKDRSLVASLMYLFS